MFNKVILAGNIARDIEIKYTQSGTAIANTAIAVNRKFKASDGTMKDETMFIDITFFSRTAEIANQYLKKGSQVLVEGRLSFEQWTAQDGSKRSKHQVVVENLQMLGSKESPTPKEGVAKPEIVHETAPREVPQSSIPEIDISDDEVPF